jgi:hypothetical protein
MGVVTNDLKLVVSHRCWFPNGAYFFSTKEIAEMAKDLGYEGVEWLSTWRFGWEMLRYRKLLAPDGMVVSGHRDWRFDRVMEAKLKGKPWWWYQFKNKEDWLFPPSGMAVRTLKRFQRRYKAPISVSWFEDTRNFSPVMLELWGRKQGVDYEGLLRWLDEDSENRGVVLDTAKFSSWLESCGLLGKRRKVMKRLLPNVFEVHFRLKKKGREAAMDARWGRLKDDTVENWNLVRELGWKGRVVVEVGWPDLDESPFGLLKEDLEKFRELHGRVREMVGGN